MNYQNALLIYNGNAGQKKTEEILGLAVPILSSYIPSLLILKTDRQGHAKELCEIHGPDMDLIIILGGDGTVHECINGVANLKKRPVIGILPGGTCNDFTRALNIEQDIQIAAKQIMCGDVIPVDVLKVDDQFSLNFWGVGLIAETSVNIDPSEKERLGKISYLLSAYRTMKEMNPFHYEMNIDGNITSGQALMIVAANGTHIGTNALPSNEIKYDDGLADIFIIKEANLSLLKEVSPLKFGKQNSESEAIEHLKGRSIFVQTNREMDADMDGEVYMKTPGRITVLKHHLKLIRPTHAK